MTLLNRVSEKAALRKSPVSDLIVPPGSDSRLGYDDSQFSPEEYGNYIATSNEIYSAAQLRARLLGTLNLRLYTGDDADKSEVTTGPAAHLLQFVNPFWTFQRLLRMDELSMCLWGESYWAIHKVRGQPKEIWWLKPSRVRVRPHTTEYIGGFVYEPEHGGDPVFFKTDEIIWFRHPNPIDEFSALSPLGAARQAADTAKGMMTSNANIFNDGLQLGGVIVPDADKVTFSPTQAAELEKMLEKRWTGKNAAHKWAVLRFEAQFKSLNITPKDAEFLGGMNLTLRQIANAYGIPVPLLNDLEHATLANVRDLQRQFWEHTLVPDANLRAEEIKEQLFPMFRNGPTHCEFDYSKVPALQESASEAWTREAQAMDRGAITINEWRKGKGMPDVQWGDAFWAPVNKAPVTDATAPVQPSQNDPAPTEDAGTEDE